MPLWRGGPNTRTLPTVLLTPSASKAADILYVPQNQALEVCRGFVPNIQVCGTHGREDLVNATIISNEEEEEVLVKLRTGRNRLNSHTHGKLKLAYSPVCLCGQEDQTTEHVLQNVPFTKLQEMCGPYHSPDDQTLRLQAGAREDDFIHLPSGADRVACERQEEEEDCEGRLTHVTIIIERMQITLESRRPAAESPMLVYIAHTLAVWPCGERMNSTVGCSSRPFVRVYSLSNHT